jgi:hypothetical protein
MKIFKYVITQENEPILFSKNLLHNKISINAISAGFLILFIDIKRKKYRVKCFGESTTLNIKSNMSLDKKIIESFLNS